MDPDAKTLAKETEGKDLTPLLREFRNCGLGGDYLNKQSSADDTRLARWDGQSDDGKKWSKNLTDGSVAFPWDGASDVRCYQADEAINESVAIKVSAFWRSDIRVEGIEPNDIGPASSSTRFMDWMRDSALRDELETEVELTAQFEDWYGWAALHVSWDRLISYRWRVVDMNELAMIGQSLEGQPIPDDESGEIARSIMAYPKVVADPDMEPIAIQITQLLYRTYVNEKLPSNMEETDIPELSKSRARKIVRELRRLGRSSVPIPYVCRNKPTISTLKPWRDIILPLDTTDIQSARAIFIRQFLTEQDLLAAVLSEGWDQQFVDEAIQTKGKFSLWTFASQGLLDPLYKWSFTQQKNELIEIIYAYHRAVDEDGISAVYCTVFSAGVTQGSDENIQALVGKTGLIDHPNIDEYPVVVFRREILDRQVMSCRGIPELLLTSQREEKVIRDSVMDLISLSTIPPLNIYKGSMGQRYRFAPAAENMVIAGREPRLMEIPESGGKFAAEYVMALRSGVDHYLGRVREDVPPQLSQLLQEPKVRRFLCCWAKALKMAFCLWQKNEPEIFERVTSEPSPGEDAEKLDFIFHFDVAQLNPDAMEKKLAAFSALLPEDTPGVINRSALIQAKARMIDPALAKQLVMESGPASQALFEKVKADMVAMSDGNEATYVDAAKDPSAPARGQYLTQIISSNIKYLQRLDPALLQEMQIQVPPQLAKAGAGQVDPIFSALVEKYIKNLQLAISQQQNKQIGRIGVNQNTGPTS